MIWEADIFHCSQEKVHDENPKKEEKLELTLPPEICRNFLGFQMLERNLKTARFGCVFFVYVHE